MSFKRIFLVGFLFLSIMLAGCSTISYYPTEQESLEDLCRQSNVGFWYDPVIRSVQLTKNDQKVYLLIDSDVANLGVDKITLNAPVTLRGNEVYVPRDFREKVFCRLDKQLCVSRTERKGFRIVIDPGHGGKDSGAIGVYGLKEKDVVLDIAKRLVKLLQQWGYDTKITRSSDTFISLEKRTEDAAQWNADLYISIHANASKSKRASGFEVWAPRALNQEDLSEAQRLKNHQLFFQHFNMQSGNRYLEATLEDMLYRYKRVESLKLASMISKKCVRSVSSENRGVKESGFFVLRNTLVPSVLIEVGFITNGSDARRFKDSSYRQNIAQMLADGVLDYIRSL